MRLLILVLLGVLAGCSQGMAVLGGATHARGAAHVEGYFTDSQTDVELCKVPVEYTAEQALEYCRLE